MSSSSQPWPPEWPSQTDQSTGSDSQRSSSNTAQVTGDPTTFLNSVTSGPATQPIQGDLGIFDWAGYATAMEPWNPQLLNGQMNMLANSAPSDLQDWNAGQFADYLLNHQPTFSSTPSQQGSFQYLGHDPLTQGLAGPSSQPMLAKSWPQGNFGMPNQTSSDPSSILAALGAGLQPTDSLNQGDPLQGGSLAPQEPWMKPETLDDPQRTLALESLPPGLDGLSEPPLSTDGSAKTSSVDRRTSVASDAEGSSSTKSERRLGITCEPCKEKHLKCDLAEKTADLKKASGSSSSKQQSQCTRCQEKDLKCTRSTAVPSRRFSRPSRTGKRIEQARQIHGSVSSNGAAPDNASMPNDPNQSSMTFPGLQSIQSTDNRLSSAVMSGAVSLRLLTCFFTQCHQHMPIVDFASFSSRYNSARGDARAMSIMLSGGSAKEDIPSLPMRVPGLAFTTWPKSGESTISTPGTSETLIAVMHAWAAHYTDLPLAFGPAARELGLLDGPPTLTRTVSSSTHTTTRADSDGDEGSPGEDGPQLPASKRPKRRQGVGVCDSCRLRRLRCDLIERKDGMACTRCQDKKIVCTDEYIQEKRKKNEAKRRREQEKRRKSVSASVDGAATSDGEHASMAAGPSNQLGDNPDPQAWTEVPGQPDVMAGSSKYPSLVPFGQARQPFCHELLTKAVVLVHKHQLLHKPSVEAVQALVLLVQLFYLVDPNFSSELTQAAASHMRLMGLQSIDEVDETDRKAVENLFILLQSKRVWCSSWTGDAISSCIFRIVPNFSEDKAIRVGAGKKDQGTGNAGPPPELSPEMGLSWSVMALMQIGVLARFVTKHIDGIVGPDLLPPQDRFPMLPTAVENRKLRKACEAVWKSNDALMTFFDRCTLKAWTQMEALKIFQPKSWIAACKSTSTMITLNIYRILGERHRLNALRLDGISKAHGSQVISAEDRAQSQALRELFESSCIRALLSCRRMARLVAKLLQKPDLTFQTGGIFLRQIFAIAQYLARTPIEEASPTSPTKTDSTGAAGRLPSSSPAPGNAAVDPRNVSSTAVPPTGMFIPNVKPDQQEAPSDLYSLAFGFDAPLPPFTAEQRKKEVESCLVALDQLGFAWAMEDEIESVKSILLRGESGKRFGHALG